MPHSQIAFVVEARPAREPTGPLAQVSVERILAHDDAEVVFGLGEQAVGVDELEPVGGFERVPLMNVAVNEHGGFVAVGVAAPLRARQCVLDGAFAARPIEFLPHRGDELGQPPRLGRPRSAGRSPAAGRQIRAAAEMRIS